MKKVREHLIAKQETLEKSAKAKKLREMKKMGKQIQQQVLKKRQEEKKEILNKVNKFKKGKSNKLDLDGSKPKIGKKAAHKNQKYGYGGQKKRSKYNTAESAADIPGLRGKGKGKGKKGQQRPGKNRRQAMRNKRK